jgi:cobaltochelatase CobS
MDHDHSLPPHMRLDGMTVKHLHKLLGNLCGGKIGFDPNRDDRTNSKTRLCAFIRATFSNDAIDNAHRELVRTYGDNKYRRRYRGGERQADAPAVPAVPALPDLPTPHIPEPLPAQAVPALPVPQPVPAMPVPAVPAGDIGAQIAALFASLTANAVNPEQIRALVDTSVKAALEKHTLQHQIHVPELPPVKVGIQHRNFSLLLKASNARLRDGNRLNIWLAGPAGSGKTTAAKAVAKALSQKFYFNGAIDQPYKLTGFVDAGGRYHTTAFRAAWEHGGIYLFDEVDGSSPAAVLEFNAALANGLATFPDSPEAIERHPDCVIIAGANTTGQGATAEYVGRMKQDAAFLDRFVVIDWPIDEALERQLCADQAWTSKVQSRRARLKDSGIKGHMISPRATLYGEALLAAGLSVAEAETLAIRKGLNDANWRQISN